MIPYLWHSGILFLLSAGWQIYRHVNMLPQIELVNKLGLCASVVFIIALFGKLIGNGTWRVNKALCQTSFFIFALHFVPVGLLRQFFGLFIAPTDFNYFWIHLLIAAMVTFFCIYGYKLLNRFLPRFLSFITGGR